ncbi:MAG: T9SS type A sorting domain-containing protein [Pseudobacter sp.]|uniref:T9SS type A sorting domain-containing protein n=1 Tax=Pseudobacter sp. TaxID=2045420 RepID=UPI003F822D19
MKKHQLSALLFCILFLNIYFNGKAQSLSAGDVSFISLTANITPKRFEFVIWKDLGASKEIRFTNCGFTDNTGNTVRWMEQYVIWTGPSTGLAKGTVVRVEGNTANYGSVATYNCSGSGTPSGLTLGNSTGNQIFAFEGTGGASYASSTSFSGTLLAGIQYQSTAGSPYWVTTPGTVIAAATSFLPTSISSYAMVVTGAPGPNEGVYSGPRTGFNTVSDYRSRVLNISNWSVQGGTTINPAMKDNTPFTFAAPPGITGHPSNSTVCAGSNTTFSITASNATSYKWQVSTNNGGSFSDLSNTAPYSGVTTTTLTITGATAGMNGYQYKCIASGSASPDATSNAGTLTVNQPGTWLGVSSSLWSNTANWSCGILPTASTNVTVSSSAPYMPVVDITSAICNDILIQAGASVSINSGQTLTIKGSATNNGTFSAVGKTTFSGSNQTLPGGSYEDLEISGTGTKTLGNSATVSGTFTITSSKLQLGNNDLTIGAGGGITGGNASSYVITNGSGSLKQQGIGTGGTTSPVIFPVGTATSYVPVTLTNAGTSDAFGVRVIQSVFASYDANDIPTGVAETQHSVSKTWMITEGTPGGSNVTLTFQWNSGDEQSGFNRTAAFPSHYKGGAWVKGATSAATGSDPYTISMSGITSFSPFGVGSTGSLLPLTLVSFTGKATAAGNTLQWVTTSEINVASFIIERSVNGADFSTTGNIQAKNASGQQQYQFIDTDVKTTTYYRLKMIDKDGTFKYSPVIIINNAATTGQLSIYPNPLVGAELNIKTSTTQKEDIMFTITDATGRQWQTGTLSASAINSGKARVIVRALPAGLYYVQAQGVKSQAINILKFQKK